MSIKIEQKIIKSAVLDKVSQQQGATSEPPKADVLHMHEKLARPESLQGITYKIKTPLSEHALYVTINDIVLNPGTEHELRRPFEIFINSKNMEHFQWIIALTRILSAVFRKGGDVTFLVDELHSRIALLLKSHKLLFGYRPNRVQLGLLLALHPNQHRFLGLHSPLIKSRQLCNLLLQ